MIATHKRKKLEIILDAPLLRRVVQRLEQCGVTAYTLLQAQGGLGMGGPWHEDQLTGATQKIILVAITGEERAGRVLESLGEFFAAHPGIVCISDVEVIRGERF